MEQNMDGLKFSERTRELRLGFVGHFQQGEGHPKAGCAPGSWEPTPPPVQRCVYMNLNLESLKPQCEGGVLSQQVCAGWKWTPSGTSFTAAD